MSNFQIKNGKNTLSILAVVTDAIISFKVEGKHFIQVEKNTNSNEGPKEAANASLLSLAIRETFNQRSGTPEAKIKAIATMLREYAELNTFRAVNNKFRAAIWNEGIINPKTGLQLFYEGTSFPLKVAARQAAKGISGKNKKAQPAPKATKKVTAPAAKKTTPVATKPAAKKTTKPAATKVTKPATKKVTKATPVAAPVSQDTAIAEAEAIIADAISQDLQTAE